MSDSQRKIRIGIVYLSLAACVFALPLSAQRIDDLAVGPVRHESRETGGRSNNAYTTGISVVPERLIAGEAHDSDESAPFTGVPLNAPKRRCEDIGPLVTGFVLGGLAFAYVLSFAPGNRGFAHALLPIAAAAAVGIGVTAAICNR